MTNPNIRSFEPSIDRRVDEMLVLSRLFGEFMKIKRATYREGQPETDGEHVLHAMFIAVCYTAKYHPEFDPAEVALLMLVHDLDEVYFGDINSLTADDSAMESKEKNETISRCQLREDLTDHPYILDLLERYWRQSEPVTKYVRAIEKLDPSFSHLQDEGWAIRMMGIGDRNEFNTLEQQAISRMFPYAPDDILALRRLLGQRVANITFGAV